MLFNETVLQAPAHSLHVPITDSRNPEFLDDTLKLHTYASAVNCMYIFHILPMYLYMYGTSYS